MKWMTTDGNQEVTFTDESAVFDVLRLFYGMRCVFGHGSPNRTLEEGVLKLPLGALNIGAPQVTTYLQRLYQHVHNRKGTADLSYALLVNMQRFIGRLAAALLAAVAEHLASKLRLAVWGKGFALPEDEEDEEDVREGDLNIFDS